jgi:mono/diheme cytochrome c family protein
MAELDEQGRHPAAAEAHLDTPQSQARRSRRWRRPALKHPGRAFAGGIALGAVSVLAVLALIVMPLAIGHRNDLPLERLYGNVAVSLAARLHAGSATNPAASNARALEAGRYAYTGSCAQCHGPTGDGKGVYGQATYPHATVLSSGDAKEKSDAELFWITKNGLSFTGMPSFGGQYSDQEIWQMVTYIRALQNGQAAPIAVPTASAQQLAMANPAGDPTQQGAAIYFAQGCQTCHGATGNAPGQLRLRDTREATEAIRNGRPGMPTYGPDRISDPELQKMIAYMNTFNNQGR